MPETAMAMAIFRMRFLSEDHCAAKGLQQRMQTKELRLLLLLPQLGGYREILFDDEKCRTTRGYS